VAIAYMIFNEYNEIWQTGIKNCLNKSFLLEQLKELMYRTENYFNTVVTFFTDQYLKYIMKLRKRVDFQKMDIIPEERIELGLPPFLYVGVDVFDSWGWGVICRKEEVRLTERKGGSPSSIRSSGMISIF
jgi:hypothetical protein